MRSAASSFFPRGVWVRPASALSHYAAEFKAVVYNDRQRITEGRNCPLYAIREQRIDLGFVRHLNIIAKLVPQIRNSKMMRRWQDREYIASIAPQHDCLSQRNSTHALFVLMDELRGKFSPKLRVYMPSPLRFIGCRPALRCKTRVGIATGLAVVGDLIGSGDAQERGIVGETPNLAATA